MNVASKECGALSVVIDPGIVCQTYSSNKPFVSMALLLRDMLSSIYLVPVTKQSA
ncbi:hypothetical protein D3C84_1107620 [compost metagenome]